MNATARGVKARGGAHGVRQANAASRQVASCTGGGNCPLCQRLGLPVLLLRHAVVHNYVSGGRGYAKYPGQLGEKVDDKKLNHHSYALRTLRQGFVYVYFGKAGHWHVYAVTPNGYLRLLPDPDDIDCKTHRDLSVQCERKGDGIPASFIHLPTKVVEKGGNIWMAFSTAAWTKAVRTRYEKDPGKRMQVFDVAKLASTPGGQAHTFAPTAQMLHDHVEEYAADQTELTSRRTYQAIEVYTAKKLNLTWEDATPLTAARIGKAPETGNYVTAYETASGGKKISGVALIDAVGIVQELNASRLYFVEGRSSYCAIWERPLTISRSILGLKALTEQNALQSREVQEAASKKPDVQTETYHFPDDLGGQTATVTTTRAQRAADDARQMWGRLASNYDEAKRKSFQDKFDEGLRVLWTLVENCDTDWAAWARDPQWKTWFDDYDPESAEQQAELVKAFAPCLAGGIVESLLAPKASGPAAVTGKGTASAAGKAATTATKNAAAAQNTAGYILWKEWLAKQPAAPDNPVYRALFGNRQAILDNLLPDGGDVKKGDKIYDTVKGLVGSDEFERFLLAPVKQAAGLTKLAITTAMNRLGDQLQEAAHQGIMRAQAAAFKLYDKVDVLIFTANITVQEYVDLLSTQAFNKAQAVTKALNLQGKQAVRSILVGGMGVLRIRNPLARNTVMTVTFCLVIESEQLARIASLKGEELKNWLREKSGLKTISEKAKTAARMASAEVGKLRLSTMTLGVRAEQLLTELSQGLSFSGHEVNEMIGGMLTRSRTLLAGSTEIGWSAGTAFFQWWVLRQSLNDYRKAFGERLPDAQMAMASAVTGTTGATIEAFGQGMKLIAKVSSQEAGTALALSGAKWALRGSVVAAGAAMFDAMIEANAAQRSGAKGDHTARVLHTAAALAFTAAAVTGTAAVLSGSTAIFATGTLLGPFGWAIALVAIGVLFAMAAANAERSVAEVWLDRCYFGKHERTEGAWTDAQHADELAGLNAIALGLDGSVGYNDDWLGVGAVRGYDTVKMMVRVPAFEQETSAFAVTLSLLHKKRGWIQAIQLRSPNLAHLPSQDWKKDYGRESDDWMHQPVADWNMARKTLTGEVEASTKYFQKVHLRIDYWQDYVASPDAYALFELADED